MSDTIKDFLVSLGFKGNEADAKKLVDLTAKTEAGITKATVQEGDKRVEAETKAAGKRVTLVQALGKLFVAAEQDRAVKADKIRKDEAVKDEKLQAEHERKARERRAAALKELQVNATRMASFALKTVAAVEATALGIVYATDRAAKGFERLNYAAQRTGAAPGKITAFGYAAGQLGSTEEAGQASLEALGQRLRTNPTGYSQVLKRLGVDARNANGHMRDTAEIAADLGQALGRVSKQGQYGYANALNYAGALGLDEQTMRATMDPRFRGRMAERQAIDAKTGANQGDAATAGTAFEQSMRRLDAVLESIRAKVETTLFKKLQPDLDKLSDWGEKHGGQVADIVARIADDIVKLANAVLENLSKVDWDTILTKVENFGKSLDKRLTDLFGENGTAVVAMAAFGLIVADKLLKPLNLVLSTLGAIGGHSLVGRLLGGTSRAALGAVTSAAGVTVAAVALGASAESTPDAATQAKQAQFYKDHPNAHATVFGAIGGWLKDKFGLGSSDPDARKVKDAIIATADATKKIADGGGTGGGGFAGVTASSGGLGGSGQHVRGGNSPGASLGDHAAPGRPFHTDQQKKNAAIITDELRKAGLPDEGIAAALGSMQTESSLNPAVPENSYNHGHHGLIQWDSKRWPKVEAWIKSQNGDPWDARWQARAFVAEGRAKPGDSLYDNSNTERGFRDLEQSKGNVDRAIQGMRGIERFGAGEEGGRAALARSILPGLGAAPAAAAPSPAGTSAKAVTDAEVFAARQRILNGSTSAADHALVERYKQQQNAPVDKTHLRNMQAVIRARHGHVLPFLHPDAHLSAAARTAINNQRNSHYAMTHAPVFNINGGDSHAMLADAHRLAGRGQADMVRNLSVMEA